MKTPQEQADKINSQLAETLFAHTRADLYDYIARLKQEIPLPELIAVAQAANDCNNRTFYAPDIGSKSLRLQNALQALRATNKIEL